MEAQTKYPDVSFIPADAEPKDKDGNVQIEDNVMSIMYVRKSSTGYLAGYAAVTGYKNLGFMGGIAVPAVIRYGYGFIRSRCGSKRYGTQSRGHQNEILM